MNAEIKKLNAAASYNAPDFASLGSVEKLTGGNDVRQYDHGPQNPTYIFGEKEEGEEGGGGGDKPKT